MPQLNSALVRQVAQNDAFMRGVCASLESAAQLCERLDAFAAAEKSQNQSEVKKNANSNIRRAA